jgi:hypothetical protein
MKPIRGSYNIVIAGAWNPSIFNPLWLHKNLLKEGEEAGIAFPINDISLPIQISIPNVKIYPSTQRLEVKPDTETPSSLESAISVTKKIASLLQHTPVNGVGFNFAFVDQEDITSIPSKFYLQDSAAIKADIFKLKQTVIKRSYELDSKQSLNIAILYDKNSVQIEFNYHYDISDMSEVTTVLDEKSASERLSQTIEFLKTVYDIDVDDNNQGL